MTRIAIAGAAGRMGRNLVLAAARAVEGHRALLVVTAQPGMRLASYSRLANFDRAELERLQLNADQVLPARPWPVAPGSAELKQS